MRGLLGAAGVVAVAAGFLTPRLTASVAAEDVHFEYTGDHGPGFWGELLPEWRACSGAGGRQSPIDISTAGLPTLPVLSPLQLTLRPTPIDLINNGHTLQQSYEEGSVLTFNGVVYELLQFHYHSLAEHTIDGVRYPLEQHAVFIDRRSGALAVIGLFYKIGATNPFFANYTALPRKEGDRVQSARRINLADSLIATDSYFAYNGSLTTPPCSEIVTFLLLKTPAEMSAAQFDEAWRIIGNNFRPTQPRAGRPVFSTPR